VSSCATCDGAFFRGKDVAVVGGGDSAMEEALFLTRFARRVVVVHRRDALRASDILQRRAGEHEKIELIWNSVVADLAGVQQGRLAGLKLRDVKSGEIRDLAVDGLFLAIGHIPNTGFVAGKLDLDGNGYVVCEPGTPRTSVEGVFAAGDVCDPVYRQAVTAAAMGCQAAIEAEKYLEKLGL
jgi:thioredoxin reductase (NADPH)